jgi:hypothetical protein
LPEAFPDVWDAGQVETGCLVADRRNGRIVELGVAAERAAG